MSPEIPAEPARQPCWLYFAGLYPAFIASASSMYLPCFVFPYQREPCLWYTPDSVLTHTIPALFACDVCCFAAPEGAGAVDAGVAEEEAEGEEAEAGFDMSCLAAGTELGAAPGVAVAGGLSAPLDWGDCAGIIKPLTRSTDATSVEATSKARDSVLALRFIALLLIEMRVHWNARSLEFRHDGEESR